MNGSTEHADHPLRRAGRHRKRSRPRWGMPLVLASMLLIGACVGVLGYISFFGDEAGTTAAGTGQGPASGKPKYSFYDDLPRPPAAADPAAAATDATDDATQAAAAETVMPPPIALISRQTASEAEPAAAEADADGDYMVQAGAFARRSDADRRKANLALLGIQATIELGVVDGGEVYRVRIGPFADAEQAKGMRQRLEQDNIPAFTVKRQ